MNLYIIRTENGTEDVRSDLYVVEGEFVNFYKKTFWRLSKVASFKVKDVIMVLDVAGVK